KTQLDATPLGALVSGMDFSVGNTELLSQFDAAVSSAKTQLTDGIAQIEAGIGQIDVGIAQIDDNIKNFTMGLSVDQYRAAQASALNEINTTLATVDNGILQLYNGETEAVIAFANGLSKLDLTEYQLASSKAQLTTGRQTLEDSKAQLEDAKEQIKDAREQLEDTKADAKEQADMTGILTIDTVTGILTAQNFSMPAGYVEEGGDSYLIRVGDKPATKEELENMVLMKLPMTDDEVIVLSDVADVFLTSNADETYTNVNGKPGVVLSIQKQTGYSTGEVSDKILARFDELKERYGSASIITLMDQGVYIDLVMNTIFQNVLIGGALAILVLIFFLRDIRPTLVIAISIPVSLIAAVVCMYFSGVTLNIISLSGLALGVGMLVDNSIVVIENIYRLRNNGVPVREAAIQGAREVAGAIFASTLTTVCVFLPIVFTEGLTRQLFVDMGLTIAFSLMASLAVALTVVPACAAGMLKKIKPRAKEGRGVFYKGYEKFLRFCLKIKPLVLLLVLGLLGLSAYGAYTNGMAYFPAMESPQISVSLGIAEDSDLVDIKEETDLMVERIAEIPDVVDIGAMSSGSALSIFGASSSDEIVTRSEIYITTKEDRELSSGQLSEKIKELASDIDGITVWVETSMMDMSALGGEGISLRIKGRDVDTLYALAEEATAILEDTEGVEKVSSDITDASPELRVHIDKEKAANKGLTVATVFMQISDKLKDPSVATTLTTATSDVSVYVHDENTSDLNRKDISNLEIEYTNDEGKKEKIPLYELADFEDGVGMNTIFRTEQTRYVGVNATIAPGHNITFVSADVEKNMEGLKLPVGYSLEYEGENEMILDAVRQLSLMIVLAVVFIYLIMVAQFQSLGSPFIIMFTIPLAFTGGLAALYFTGFEISIVAMIGFVMLAGIIVNNGIVLVDYINQRRAEGLSKKEAIIDAGITRLRPVLMTALTTILALLIMAFSTQMGADMSRPMAIVVIGGMIYGTLMTLIVVPCIYDMFVREKKNKDKGG
ncbi:MAG: efflux RND transporter permease subunit, partial [Lachnospiraceae bacterium]|nr:efflux RND transporter permease subunit [Lachnospiraceae bacterium]